MSSVSDKIVTLPILFLMLFVAARFACGQGTAFSYQGKLTVGGVPANGNYDLQFALFDNLSGGTQIGSTLSRSNTVVSNGVFTVQLDYGANAFPGEDRFLDISVRPTGVGTFTTLAPRQQISSTPYAIRSITSGQADSATTATNATQLGGVAANQYVLTGDSRLSDARAPTAGSGNYIQNTNTEQPGANFNISGNGTASGTLSANVVNATTQYNVDGQRVLNASTGNGSVFLGFSAGSASTAGVFNSVFGTNAGQATTGEGNSFFGAGSGQVNQSGSWSSFFGFQAGLNNKTNANSFFGYQAGRNNTDGFANSFFGFQAGFSNSTGHNNSFFGNAAGVFNTTGFSNSFFGTSAGANTKDGSSNAFFGTAAGASNTTACCNSFFGANAGLSTTTGQGNSFFGGGAGQLNVTGERSTFIGFQAGFNNTANENSFFGYQAGYNNGTGVQNSFFGTRAEINNTGSNANVNSFFGYEAGLNNQGGANSFFGVWAGKNNTIGETNSFFGRSAGVFNTEGSRNSYFGYLAGSSNTTGQDNAFVGYEAGQNNSVGSNNTILGASANVGDNNLNFATAIGSNAVVSASDAIVLGKAAGTYDGVARPADEVQIPGHVTAAGIAGTGSTGNGVYGSTNAGFGRAGVYGVSTGVDGAGTYGEDNGGPNAVGIRGKSDNGYAGYFDGKVHVEGSFSVSNLGGGGATSLCRNAAHQFADCSSSLRYKTHIKSFRLGLNVIDRLQPITFNWKLGGMKDLGLAAEEVAKVEPLLVTYNDKGEIEGVKYSQLSAVFINAFKEQQAQIKAQQAKLSEQQRQLEALKKKQQQFDALKELVCTDHPTATLCKK